MNIPCNHTMIFVYYGLPPGSSGNPTPPSSLHILFLFVFVSNSLLSSVSADHIYVCVVIQWGIKHLPATGTPKETDSLSGRSHQLPIAPHIGLGPWRPGPVYAGILPALVLGRLPQLLCADESTSPWPEVGAHRSPAHLLVLSYHLLPEVPCTLECGRCTIQGPSMLSIRSYICYPLCPVMSLCINHPDQFGGQHRSTGINVNI